MSVRPASRRWAAPPAAPDTALTTLVDQLLAEQAGGATAVEAFSHWHARQEAHHGLAGSLRTDQFRSLIPLSRPGPGEQYAFEVNLSQCTGCKACVTACHSLNGLDETESWRDVGLVVGRADPGCPPPAAQTVTTACHHCADPACANGCPVLAYEKDATTGIVRHLDDQCIGCSYCILKCPYDVPKFNARRGIVRKCDMCHQRLAVGEAPACVQSCPTEAIAIRLVDRHPAVAPGDRLVPGAFTSDYTRPTTRYVGGSMADASGAAGGRTPRPADAAMVREDAAHTPLAVMLVLLQLATGGLVMGIALGTFSPRVPPLTTITLASTVIGILGLAASVLHLGQPLKAWRIFLGWRKSWLSREAMVFGAFASSAAAAAAQAWSPWSALPSLTLPALTAVLGIAGVAASAMVYIDTRRPFWSAGLVVVKFGGTTLLLGAGLVSAVWAWQGVADARTAALTAWALLLVLSCWEASVFRSALDDPSCPWHRSALVMRHLQPQLLRARVGLLLIAGGLLPVAALNLPDLAPALLTLTLVCMTTSQLIERHQFFTACAGPRMPGLA